MRVAHYLIRADSGLFYFRLRVPADLRQHLGMRLIKRATGTRCPREALALSVGMARAYARAFEAMRTGADMKGPKVEDILASMQERGVVPREYVIKTPGGFQIEATDAQDHRRAIQMVKALGPSALAPAPAAAAPASSSAKLSGATAKDAYHKWRIWLMGKHPNEKMRNAKSRPVADFIKWKQSCLPAGAPDFVMETLTRTDCSEWSIVLQGGGLAPGTMENKFIYLAGFFDWCMAAGHYPKGDNPARGHANVSKRVKRQRAKSHGWQAFTAKQLPVIFNPATYEEMRSEDARWLPLLALYTGARSNELAHLELADIYADKDGTHLLDFNLRGEHKSLKTEASERRTPVHPDLVALGLLARVDRLRAEGETKLFPGLTFTAQNGPANAAQRAFTRHLERVGVEARKPGRVGHHSFRDTLIDLMKQAGVPREVREEYTGHEKSDRQEHANAYEQDLTPGGLARACHGVMNFGLDLPALKALLR